MVNVNPNKWNVKVIGIHSPPSGSEDQNRLPLFAVPCRFSAVTTEYHKFFSISPAQALRPCRRFFQFLCSRFRLCFFFRLIFFVQQILHFDLPFHLIRGPVQLHRAVQFQRVLFHTLQGTGI